MLVFSRSIGEAIVIGDDIRVHIVEANGDKVRLGINAPRNITVYREEVYIAATNATKRTKKRKISAEGRWVEADDFRVKFAPKVKDGKSPSNRTLQDWRQGEKSP